LAAGLYLLFAFAGVGCGGGSSAAPAGGAGLDGVWTTRSNGVLISLTLTWRPDSVNGPGTYVVLGNTLGCGGGSLQGSGNMTFAASRSSAAITGRFTFDNGWKPLFAGSLSDSSHITGALQSTDGSHCPFSLSFGLVP
jgi:hypothetical protein